MIGFEQRLLLAKDKKGNEHAMNGQWKKMSQVDINLPLMT